MNTYKTVEAETTFTTTIEKSKFICRIAPTKSEDMAKNFLFRIVKSETGATHNCYAYILEGETAFKFSDDGEPHGTAGQPILDALKSYDLKNVIAVVTRYFGGIKLGTGGLSRAYFTSVKNCLTQAKVVDKRLCCVYRALYDYNTFSRLMSFFSQDKVKVIKTDYLDGVSVEFACPIENESNVLNELTAILNGKLSAIKVRSEFITF